MCLLFVFLAKKNDMCIHLRLLILACICQPSLFSIVFTLLMSHGYILFKIGFAFVYIKIDFISYLHYSCYL